MACSTFTVSGWFWIWLLAFLRIEINCTKPLLSFFLFYFSVRPLKFVGRFFCNCIQLGHFIVCLQIGLFLDFMFTVVRKTFNAYASTYTSIFVMGQFYVSFGPFFIQLTSNTNYYEKRTRPYFLTSPISPLISVPIQWLISAWGLSCWSAMNVSCLHRRDKVFQIHRIKCIIHPYLCSLGLKRRVHVMHRAFFFSSPNWL